MKKNLQLYNLIQVFILNEIEIKIKIEYKYFK
jgi:hypothetical protein